MGVMSVIKFSKEMIVELCAKTKKQLTYVKWDTIDSKRKKDIYLQLRDPNVDKNDC